MSKTRFFILPLLALLLWACDPKEPVDPPTNDTVPTDVDPTVNYRFGPAHDTLFEARGIEFRMIFVPSGTFTMGATTTPGNAYDPDADADEMPPHSVSLSPFLIAELEVSQFLFYSVMHYNPSQTAELTLPVHNVSYYVAQQFIDSLSAITSFRFRLPTEAEWEYAAKGGPNAANSPYFAGSNNADSVGWSVKNSDNMPHRSALLKPNALGIYDMSGNVREWCSDWFGPYIATPQANPQGPEMPSNANLQKHACRGGSFLDSPYYLRNTARRFYHSAIEDRDMGIRLVLPVK